MDASIVMRASLLGAVFVGLVAGGLAQEAPAGVSSSISPLELITAIALVCATALSFVFWYVANKPNIIVKPAFKSGSTTVVITNEGRIPAKALRVMSAAFKPVRDSDDALDVLLPAMYPKEQIEYFVAPGHEAVKYEPYEFIVSHRRWLFRWPAERRKFKIDFKQYEAILADLHVSTPLEHDMGEIARIGNTLIQMHVNKKDRFRLWRTVTKRRGRQMAKWVVSRIKKLARPDA